MTEGEKNYIFLLIRLGHVEPALNVLNVNGGIETIMTKQEVTENWVRLKKEITNIKERDEGLVLIGDMNRAIINIVEGNHPTVLHGGSLIRELLNSIQEAEGGPWTLVSRVDSSVKSCLDLVVMSANLTPYPEMEKRMNVRTMFV